MSETDYEQLYHLMNQRRGEELQKLEELSRQVAYLVDMFVETDRQVAHGAETQSEPDLMIVTGGKESGSDSSRTLDSQIDAFLLRLDHRFHLKRATTARTALKLLFLEEESVKSMGALYAKTAELTGGTVSSVERNLRSYREALKEAATDFYRANLAQYNINNAEFYWNALRVLKQDMR